MPDLTSTARDLIDVGKRFDARGWVLGTSGNFSVVLARDPLRLAMTSSGTHKGQLVAGDILEIDGHGSRVPGPASTARPSAEALLHLELVSARGAGAVLHTHSIWSTIASERAAAAGGVAIDGYEMLKGLSGVTTHEHREWIPVLENDQDMRRLAGRMRETLDANPGCHAFLLRRHGLYTWGATLPEAVRHVEILEFLLETIGRLERS